MKVIIEVKGSSFASADARHRPKDRISAGLSPTASYGDFDVTLPLTSISHHHHLRHLYCPSIAIAVVASTQNHHHGAEAQGRGNRWPLDKEDRLRS